MLRKSNTNKAGHSFSRDTIDLVWTKGRAIPDFSPAQWRWDKCGAVIEYSNYGDRDSEHGWEIDHINPVSNGGSDNPSNLQLLNWRNNVEKGDKTNWSCP